MPIEEIVAWLSQNFQRMEAIKSPANSVGAAASSTLFARRRAPYRLEFLGDTIESIRQFSETQRSLGDVQAIEIRPGPFERRRLYRGHLCDYLPTDA